MLISGYFGLAQEVVVSYFLILAKTSHYDCLIEGISLAAWNINPNVGGALVLSFV